MRDRRPSARRAIVVLGAIAALALSAGPAAGQTQVGGDFDESTIADGYDYLYTRSALGWIQSSRVPLNTLGTNTPAANPMSASGLVLLKTICLRWDNVALQGKHCFRKYRPSSDSDPRYKYRLWWVTGSTAATSGRRLLSVRDGFNTSTNGVFVADWRPTGTTEAGSCYQISLGLSLGAYGIGASIGTTFTVCPEKFGPTHVGDRLFRFRWTGNRGAGNYVGAGGGALYAVPEGTNAKFLVGLLATYCNTSSSSC